MPLQKKKKKKKKKKRPQKPPLYKTFDRFTGPYFWKPIFVWGYEFRTKSFIIALVGNKEQDRQTNRALS